MSLNLNHRFTKVHEVGVTNDVPTSSCFELGPFKRFRQVMGSRDSELPDRANFAARLSLLVTLSVDSRVPSHPGSDSMSQSFLGVKCASPNQSSSLQLVQSLVPVLSWAHLLTSGSGSATNPFPNFQYRFPV